jgi:hypothetical protein
MVACFYYSRVQVLVFDVLVGCSVTQEDASEVVTIELSSTFAGALNAYACAKKLERGQVRLAPVVSFEGCLLGFAVCETVVQVN